MRDDLVILPLETIFNGELIDKLRDIGMTDSLYQAIHPVYHPNCRCVIEPTEE